LNEAEKKACIKVNLVLFIVYLAHFVVVLSCFVRIEDFMLIAVYLLYIQGKNFAGSWRALLASD